MDPSKFKYIQERASSKREAALTTRYHKWLEENPPPPLPEAVAEYNALVTAHVVACSAYYNKTKRETQKEYDDLLDRAFLSADETILTLLENS
jgi:hypothetical protein